MPVISPSRFFPSADRVDADGLIGLGGKLTPQWLLDAYQHGIFPWPMSAFKELIPWWSPDPRAIIELDRFHVPRRLRRTCRNGPFDVTRDEDFAGVIEGCATAQGRVGETWLIPEMIEAYVRLHQLGHAHSIEVWHQGKLAGGAYGVSIGGLFAGESKFHRIRDASKVALVHLVDHLRCRGYSLFDIQQFTPHTAQFGAIEISRKEYLARLAVAVSQPVTFEDE